MWKTVNRSDSSADPFLISIRKSLITSYVEGPLRIVRYFYGFTLSNQQTIWLQRGDILVSRPVAAKRDGTGGTERRAGLAADG
jgi:hypothetical protein